MRYQYAFCLLFLQWIFGIHLLYAAVPEYRLSSHSEEYNTRYFYCYDFYGTNTDSTLYVKTKLPESFVVELGALRMGEKTAFVYDENKELVISNRRGFLFIGDKSLGRVKRKQSKISLYFVNGKLIVYIDDWKKKGEKFKIDRKKPIGIRLSKEKGYMCRYFNCYEPVAFKVADYGATLEEGVVVNNTNVRTSLHNVGEAYSLTFPTDITFNSKRSIRFEYRYDNSKKSGINEMRRGRSEISGVFSNSPKNKWVIEYDLYVPEEMKDDDSLFECITQIHEGSEYPTVPSFCLKVKGGILYGNIKGDSTRIENWSGKNNPTNNYTHPLLYLEKNRWYHVKVYLKEGWRQEDMPLTKIWINGRLLLESNSPNCYTYSSKSTGEYNYLKFGIYKSAWLKNIKVNPATKVRTYYFDNFTVKF